MGLFDFLTGTKKPKPGLPAAARSKVEDAILALNRETAPYTIHPCTDGSCDFVAEWRIVEAQWYEIFAKAGLKKVFRIKMRLDESKHEVRAVDEDFTVSWTAGVPTLKAQASGFRGQKTEMSAGLGYAFTEELRPGEVYRYRFNSSELKKPLQRAVTEKGWTWRGVAFGKL
ncbi:MAG TPA: hypothetical protein ENK28_02900 [Aliiroseovarius sp.]|nr:hypothetical protein [Aliiroseovarius sp.]